AESDKITGLFVWVPDVDEVGHLDRYAMLLLPVGAGLLSLSRRNLHGVERFAPVPGAGDGLPFVSRMIAVVLNRVIRGNEQLAGRCEQRLRELEEVPIEESRPAFFELTFRLKKQLSAAQADLWRLKGIAAELGNGRRDFVELPPAALARIQRFKSDVDYLYDTLANIREEVLSIIDLHLNVVSFGMNRVMRVLAVISALGLIPAVVGGLLGMNLIDNPWPVTLPQIAFAVLFAMVLGLYFFIVKGWLR
ncbi:MAG TPA: CorA family divalent cation transporter, partial [Gammaproteobacteria bacterium]|nr:CorA family divalent cation transporter [Gammaproteobacteria bacterium]